MKIQLSLKRLPDSSVSSVDVWRQEGRPVKTRSKLAPPAPINTAVWQSIHGFSITLMDGDFSTVVVDLTSVSPEICSLPYQKSDPSLA